MKSEIIFLGFEQGCGKDTLGKILVEEHGYTRVSFADAMKHSLAKELGIDVSLLLNQGKEKEKYRKEMIKYAEEAKITDPYVWITKAFEPYMENYSFKDNLKLAVTDFRREIEVMWYYTLWKEINNRKEIWPNIPKNQINVNLRMFHIQRPNINDKDVLTHKAIGLVKGINLCNPGFLNGVISNDSTITSLKKKLLQILK